MNPFFTKSDRIQQLYPRFSVYIGHPLTKTTEKLSGHQMHTGTPPATRLLGAPYIALRHHKWDFWATL